METIMQQTSYVVLVKVDDKEIVCEEKESFEEAMKAVEDMVFKGSKKLRIAQVIANVSVSPKEEQ
jgi:hypothetical protein